MSLLTGLSIQRLAQTVEQDFLEGIIDDKSYVLRITELQKIELSHNLELISLHRQWNESISKHAQVQHASAKESEYQTKQSSVSTMDVDVVATENVNDRVEHSHDVDDASEQDEQQVSTQEEVAEQTPVHHTPPQSAEPKLSQAPVHHPPLQSVEPKTSQDHSSSVDSVWEPPKGNLNHQESFKAVDAFLAEVAKGSFSSVDDMPDVDQSVIESHREYKSNPDAKKIRNALKLVRDWIKVYEKKFKALKSKPKINSKKRPAPSSVEETHANNEDCHEVDDATPDKIPETASVSQHQSLTSNVAEKSHVQEPSSPAMKKLIPNAKKVSYGSDRSPNVAHKMQKKKQGSIFIRQQANESDDDDDDDDCFVGDRVLEDIEERNAHNIVTDEERSNSDFDDENSEDRNAIVDTSDEDEDILSDDGAYSDGEDEDEEDDIDFAGDDDVSIDHDVSSSASSVAESESDDDIADYI